MRKKNTILYLHKIQKINYLEQIKKFIKFMFDENWL